MKFFARAEPLSLWRFLFGIYVVVYTIGLIPYASELFSRSGMIVDPRMNPTFDSFPLPLVFWDSPATVTALVALKAMAGICIALGLVFRPACALAYFVTFYCVNRNNFAISPELPFMGWLFLACLFFRRRSPQAFPESIFGTRYVLPYELVWGGWILLGITYSYSGLAKFQSTGWYSGEALLDILRNSQAHRDWYQPWLETIPELVFRVVNWFVVGIELVGAVIVFWPRGRIAYAWLMTAIHLALIFLFDVTQISLGMIVFQAFLLASSRRVEAEIFWNRLKRGSKPRFATAALVFFLLLSWAKVPVALADWRPLNRVLAALAFAPSPNPFVNQSEGRGIRDIHQLVLRQPQGEPPRIIPLDAETRSRLGGPHMRAIAFWSVLYNGPNLRPDTRRNYLIHGVIRFLACHNGPVARLTGIDPGIREILYVHGKISETNLAYNVHCDESR